MAMYPNCTVTDKITEAVTDEMVCPDGNEQSCGTGISNLMFLSFQHGLGRAARGFKHRLHNMNPIDNPNNINNPDFR